MALELAGKNPAKFIFNDGVSETTVTIQPDDPPDTVRAKLQRVLELEQGPGLPARQPGAALAAAMAQPQFTPADRAAEEARLAAVQTSGWNEGLEDGIENLPEY